MTQSHSATPTRWWSTSTRRTVANNPPIADAGDDQTVASEQAGVTLDGTGSSDPDGDSLTYSWSQISGPSVSLSGADTATPSFDAPVGPATLEFELEVCDAEPLCDTDTVVVNVNAPVVAGIDAAAKLKVDDKLDTKDRKQKVYVEVTNLGTEKLRVDPKTEVSLDALVNGSPEGRVVLRSKKAKKLKPGKSAKFKFYWYPRRGEPKSRLECGDSVEYTGTVSVAGDSMPGNDSDSETVTVSSEKKKECPPVVAGIDAAAKLKVDDKLDTKDRKQKVYVEVTNLGTEKLRVDPKTEVSLDALVNGSPEGRVVLRSKKAKKLKPGKSAKFKFYWYPRRGEPKSRLECGDSVEYTGTVSVAGDSMPGNDSDSETVTVSSEKKKKCP